MRIAIFVTNAANTYGGGRLAAFLLASCLARAGAAVCFVTNTKPIFYEELKSFGAPGQVDLYLTKDFVTGMPAGRFDIGIIVPGQSQDRQFYIGARGFVIQRGARLALFNFETPNWFNAFSPSVRDDSGWLEWRRCMEDGCLVLSNSKESMLFAQRYYCSHPNTTFFDYWHQPINVKALARVATQYRENRVVCFVRAQDPHKGGQDLMDALSEDLRGWTLSLIVGSPKLDDAFRETIQSIAVLHGIRIEVKPLLSDMGKFVELKRARMLLYPSLFEGYGIPPIEALAAATPCVCYDLPVFREVCGRALLAAPVGDIAGLRERVREVIRSSPEDWSHLPGRVASVADIRLCGEAALASLRRYLEVAATPQVGPTLPTRPMRPSQYLVNVSRLRLDPAGYAEIEGWTPLGERSRVVAYINGTLVGSATYGLTRKDVLENNPWVGTSHSGFIIAGPCQCADDTLEVTAYALGADGTVLDTVRRVFERAEVSKGSSKPEPNDYKRGAIKVLKGESGAVVSGWVAARGAILNLQLLAGGRQLWLQRGRIRPDVMAKLAGFPGQAPGFAAYLTAEEMAAAEEGGRLLLLTTTSGGLVAENIPLKPEDLIAGEPEQPPLPGLRDRPDTLPVTMQLRSATYDEYGVVEFEGWVLAEPRPALLRFFLGEVMLGESIPDRLNINVFEKNRAYGDAFCGFQFSGRAVGLPPDQARFRVEVHGDDAIVHVVEGVAQITRRADAPLGADAAHLPPGFLDDPGRPPLIALVIDTPAALDVLKGAALRAFMAHLRGLGHELMIILHGNPHLFAVDLPRWQRLCEAYVLVNALTPAPAPAATVAGETGTAALTSVITELARQSPRLRAVVAWGGGLRSALSGLPAHRGVTALVLERTLAGRRAAAPPVDVEWASFAGPQINNRTKVIGYDWSGLAAQIPAVAVRMPAGAPIVALDGTAASPALLARAIQAAAKPVAAAGFRLGVVVDAPPLEPLAALRLRMGLPEGVVPLWPASLAAAAPSTVRVLVDLGPPGDPAPLAAAAAARDIPVALWAEMTSGDTVRPWPRLALDKLLQGDAIGRTRPEPNPYSEVDGLFAPPAVLPMQRAAE